MKHRYIGKTGLRVSPICMGTMTFGTSTSKEEAFKILDASYENGINFFDTAELYPIPVNADYQGTTEKIVGEWLKTKSRDSVILATKVSGASNGWFVPPTRHGLTAIDSFHIKSAIEGSLKRLGTDYVDLYQMHWPDTIVPIEESLKAFDALVKEGKVRYIGTSNDSTYGLTKATEIAKHKNLARFESIQNNFSLNNPRFLDELANVCRQEKISLLPYSPLGGGVLSTKYNNNTFPEGARFSKYLEDKNPRVQAQAMRFVNDKTKQTTAEYAKLAAELNISPLTFALAWSKQFDFVASTIVGARLFEQLDPLFAALDYELDEQTMSKVSEIQSDILYPMG